MDEYKIIVEQEHSTVMAHYEVEQKRTVIERLKAFLSKFLNTTEDSYYEAPQTAKIYTMPDEEHELSQAAEEEER